MISSHTMKSSQPTVVDIIFKKYSYIIYSTPTLAHLRRIGLEPSKCGALVQRIYWRNLYSLDMAGKLPFVGVYFRSKTIE